LPFALLVALRVVIDPEERCLVTRLAQAYPDHRTRTRRWL